MVAETEQSGSAAASSNDQDSETAKDRGQHRRAQVRRAQIQHRQRKANYAKQLETDVANLRELVTTTEAERRALRADNEAIRARLNSSLSPFGLPELPAPQEDRPSLFAHVNVDELAMAMEMDDVLSSPIYQITSTASPSSGAVSSPQCSSAGLPEPGPGQTQQAINFILA